MARQPFRDVSAIGRRLDFKDHPYRPAATGAGRHRDLVEAEAEPRRVEDEPNDPVKGVGCGGDHADGSALLRLHVTFSRRTMIISWFEKISQNSGVLAGIAEKFPAGM
jgi:hypothetical protein